MSSLSAGNSVVPLGPSVGVSDISSVPFVSSTPLFAPCFEQSQVSDVPPVVDGSTSPGVPVSGKVHSLSLDLGVGEFSPPGTGFGTVGGNMLLILHTILCSLGYAVRDVVGARFFKVKIHREDRIF